MNYRTIISLFILAIALISCNSGPEVVEAEESSTPAASTAAENNGSVLDEVVASQAGTSSEHEVVVEDVLHTDKYTYLDVTENGEKFWIAVPKSEIEKGETVYYTGGLLKKNFFSREYNRVFETLYLVSGVRTKSGGSAVDQALNQIQPGNALPEDAPINVKPAAGSVSLSELFANKEKYEGKKVKVTGKCIKVNPNIMGRNWIHLQDGTVEDKDLTVTTSENIPVGQVVTVEGTIVLDKDFGAGYHYDIIMEGAVLK